MNEHSPYPLATAHDPIERLLPDLFWVHGSVEFRPGRFLSRNMAIVRRGRDLSSGNAVVLSPEERSARPELRASPVHGEARS